MNYRVLPDNEELSNFREVKCGRIGAGILFRSSYPLHGDDVSGIIARFAANAGINCVLNLNDSNAIIAMNTNGAAWYEKLAAQKNVIGLNMDLNIASSYFNQKLQKGLRFMISHNGPYLIHCFAGVDRTGFVCAVLEALMGASLDEICRDYLRSFGGGFSSAFEYSSAATENSIADEPFGKNQILDQLQKMNRGEEVSDKNIQRAAERYLLDAVGLARAELDSLTIILRGQKEDVGAARGEM